MADPVLVPYTQEEADAACNMYQKWIDESYPKLKASVDDVVARWQAVRLIALNALEYTKGNITGTIADSDEMTDTALDEFVITLDCCPVAPDDMEELDLETDPQNVERIKAAYAEKIWNAIVDTDTQYKIANPDGCSPEISIDITSSYNNLSIVRFEWDSRGGVGSVDVETTVTPPGGEPITTTTSTQMIHMLTKDIIGDIYGVVGGWVEQCAFALSFGEGDAKQAFRFPTGERFTLATLPAPELNEKVALPIDMKLSGRLIEVPKKLGGYVVPATSPGLMNGGMEIEEGWHFMAYMWNYKYMDWLWDKAQDRTPPINPYLCYLLPTQYQRFLSIYYDHPLFTRENIYPIVAKTPEQEIDDLVEVDNYVNDTFVRVIEEYDEWHFLNTETFLGGDCEDFSLTKAQMLIERGWDVKRLKLEGGWYSYLPNIGEDPEIKWQGHMWLVVDDAIALDVNEDSLETLRARYHERRVIQSNEVFTSATIQNAKICWWEQVDDWAMLYKSEDQRLIKIEPFPSISFDMSMWDMAGEIERTK